MSEGLCFLALAVTVLLTQTVPEEAMSRQGAAMFLVGMLFGTGCARIGMALEAKSAARMAERSER